ncbi:hypothetical protein [Paenibacillus andongensis]|uniref:hypothetical protein n=1 Tax=Paenibacillus andongensis TaxID=2975482 RepID=UPI0021BAD858|nr:hypothetical protein [Paenibacillus andongensis]
MAIHIVDSFFIAVRMPSCSIQQLRDIPWKDDRIATTEGPMFRKIAPSLEA